MRSETVLCKKKFIVCRKVVFFLSNFLFFVHEMASIVECVCVRGVTRLFLKWHVHRLENLPPLQNNAPNSKEQSVTSTVGHVETLTSIGEMSIVISQVTTSTVSPKMVVSSPQVTSVPITLRGYIKYNKISKASFRFEFHVTSKW